MLHRSGGTEPAITPLIKAAGIVQWLSEIRVFITTQTVGTVSMKQKHSPFFWHKTAKSNFAKEADMKPGECSDENKIHLVQHVCCDLARNATVNAHGFKSEVERWKSDDTGMKTFNLFW